LTNLNNGIMVIGELVSVFIFGFITQESIWPPALVGCDRVWTGFLRLAVLTTRDALAPRRLTERAESPTRKLSREGFLSEPISSRQPRGEPPQGGETRFSISGGGMGAFEGVRNFRELEWLFRFGEGGAIAKDAAVGTDAILAVVREQGAAGGGEEGTRNKIK